MYKRQVLGVYYLMAESGSAFVKDDVKKVRYTDGEEYPIYATAEEAISAHALGRIGMHAKVVVRMPTVKMVVERETKYAPERGRILTTAGRCIFNDILPMGMSYYNMSLGQKDANRVISDCYQACLLYTSPSPRDRTRSRMPSSA